MLGVIDRIEWLEGLAMHRVTGPLTLEGRRECMVGSHHAFELIAELSASGRFAIFSSRGIFEHQTSDYQDQGVEKR